MESQKNFEGEIYFRLSKVDVMIFYPERQALESYERGELLVCTAALGPDLSDVYSLLKLGSFEYVLQRNKPVYIKQYDATTEFLFPGTDEPLFYAVLIDRQFSREAEVFADVLESVAYVLRKCSPGDTGSPEEAGLGIEEEEEGSQRPQTGRGEEAPLKKSFFSKVLGFIGYSTKKMIGGGTKVVVKGIDICGQTIENKITNKVEI